MKQYHNTKGYDGEQLTIFTVKAQNQDEKILNIFKKYKSLSPSQAWQVYGNDEAPLTSIRRAITNLTKRGLLEQTVKQIEGVYGRPESVWTLKCEL
jgi:predicted transcriptional regulator